MDSDIEQIHNIVLDAHLPASVNDLKNPTEEYVVNLITAFLRRFQIDVSVIDKPTMEQQNVMSYIEDTEIIGLLNLHVVMRQICERIYIKELCITDIISPGSKRVRKQAKFLANFILYTTTKSETDIKDKVNEIKNKAKILNDMLERKNELLKMINDKALRTAKQLSLKDQYIIDIQQVQSKLENNNKKHAELMAKMSVVEEKKQRAVELCGSYKAQALKLSKTITELQSEIVKSPEEYKKRLKEMEIQQSSKDKQREIMQETFQDKKHLVEQQKVILTFIQKQLDKFGEVRDMNEQLKNICAQGDSVKKQVEMLRVDIKEVETRLKSQKDEHRENKVDELHTQYEERLSPLCSLNTQLLSKKKLCKDKLKEEQVQYNEDFLKLKKMQSVIKKLEEETVVLINNYQHFYDNEMAVERALCNIWINR